MARDYYEVLGVGRDADEAQVKKAFRRLARELHPDVNAHDPDAEAKFKEAAEAYEVLADAERRQLYDAYGHDGLKTGGYAPNFEGFGSISDLFSAFFGAGGFDGAFGGGRARGGAVQGGDVAVAVAIDLAEAAHGAQVEVAYDVRARCDTCNGNGAEPGTPIHTCERCEGSGQIQEQMRSVFGQVVRAMPCDRCGGDGRVPESPCGTCRGAGRVAEERTWEVDVPAGIEDGQRIRIAGAGHEGDPGARAGDLYVEVRVAADERFARQGTELITRLQVPVTTAMLGGTMTVPTIEGSDEVEVPAGAQHGDVEVLKGHGLPPLQGKGRGDLHVALEVVVPTDLSDEGLELVRRLDEDLAGRDEPAAARKPK